MKIEFGPAKSEKNARERGLAFDLVADFDFESAQITKDERRDYGEVRYRAVGRLNDAVAVVVFTTRHEAVRVISLRLANRKERSRYEEEDQDQGGHTG